MRVLETISKRYRTDEMFMEAVSNRPPPFLTGMFAPRCWLHRVTRARAGPGRRAGRPHPLRPPALAIHILQRWGWHPLEVLTRSSLSGVPCRLAELAELAGLAELQQADAKLPFWEMIPKAQREMRLLPFSCFIFFENRS